jgi:hypothetical protein
MMPEGGVADAGDVLESDPPNRLVIRWRNAFSQITRTKQVPVKDLQSFSG